MLRSYLKTAWRNITRHKAYSALNIAGLSIGMACSILILLWVKNERSYDRFHTNADQLYRLTCGAGDFKAAVSAAGMAEGLRAELPQIKSTVRTSKPITALLQVGDRKFEEKRLFFVDTNFLQVFSFPLAKGNAAKALQNRSGILITEDMAVKYFGDENPLGKAMRLNNNESFTVAGVLANLPSNSHLQFDFIMPMTVMEGFDADLRNKIWDNFNFYTYIQLQEHAASPAVVSGLLQQIHRIYKSHKPDAKIDFKLQPITDIHLYSNLQIDLPGQGNVQYVNIFFVVAIFILAVACINFMNLATARSARRAKEIGLRKVVGAARSQIILQFLAEALTISFVSLLFAIVLVTFMLPLFNQLAQKQLVINLLDRQLVISLFAIAFVTGIISGSYPALFLSGFRPVNVLKGKVNILGAHLLLRNGLVVMQFVVAIILLAGTAVVYKQLHFIRNKNLGFEKSNLLYFAENMGDKRQALQASLKQNPLTAEFSVISDLPTALITGNTNIQWTGKDPNSQIVIPSIDVDENFIEVFRINMLSGRGFSKAYGGDSSNYVINETAMRLMGLTAKTAVGGNLSFNDNKGTIIGVVKDFNFKSLQYTIEPLILRLNKYGGLVMIRTQPGATEATIPALEKIFHTLRPDYPFAYNFLDQDLDNLYRGEQQMGSIFNLFAGLAVFISCLGLYGLSAFMAEQRAREIGVRKVLGASVFNIVYLLSGNFTRLIFIAMVIAIPVSWIAVKNWLSHFAYRTEINGIIFLAASCMALFIAWATVSYESIKAATTNPVKTLRSE